MSKAGDCRRADPGTRKQKSERFPVRSGFGFEKIFGQAATGLRRDFATFRAPFSLVFLPRMNFIYGLESFKP